MFHLWIGLMAGILLAYLWMRSRAPQWREPWRSWRWWLAAFAVLIIITPVIWEVLRTALGRFGPLEAFKTVLLPWAAGVGFGIWIYLAIGPLPLAPTRASSRPPNDETAEAATVTERDLSFIPIAFALLFVTVIVSDQQYGWLSRLQKLTISGGGVEFASRPSGPPPPPNYAPAPELKLTGEGRVSHLIAFMKDMAGIICRDIKYAANVGYLPSTTIDCNMLPEEFKGDFPPKEFKYDLSFAQKLAVPLGKHLDVIHGARRYNNIGLLIDRSFVDSFRSFTLSHRDGVPEAERRRLAEDVRGKILALWERVCLTETSLSKLGATAAGNDVSPCTNDLMAANLWLSPEQNEIVLEHLLPYGTLLAANLLSAADEVPSAVQDLDAWVDANQPDGDHPDQFYRRFGVYRALVESTLLLMGDTDLSPAEEYLIIEHNRRLLDIGKNLLSSTYPPDGSQVSWRAQIRRAEKGDGIDPMWQIGICANDLKPEFKIFMTSYLSASNNLAYFLNRNIEFAEREGLLNDMERQAKHLADKINMRCLLDNRTLADQSQAAFLDTAAAVELTLARRTKNRTEKRSHLCDAHKYANQAVTLQSSTIPHDSVRSLKRNGYDQLVDLVSYRHHVEEIEQQLTSESLDGDC